MKYYSSIKKNEIMPFVGKWVELEIIILIKCDKVRKLNIAFFHSFGNLGLKLKKTIIPVDLKCKRDTVYIRVNGMGRGKGEDNMG
jgi:hypothetical protein